MVQPVGLLGEFRYRTRVAGVSAAMSFCTFSVQPVGAKSSATVVTRAPRILGISCRFGQSGTTSTTWSPGSTRSWEASIRALTPALVTAIWFGSVLRCSRVM